MQIVLILALFALASSSSVVPIDWNGNPVDWWIAIKLPADLLNNSCPSPICTGSTYPDSYSGLACLYADANTPAFVYKTCLGQGNDALSNTLNQIWDGSSGSSPYFQIWNDQFNVGMHSPDKSQGCEAPGAHSKGALAYDDDGNGWYLSATTPAFPDISTTPPENALGCQSDNNLKLAQQFFCFSLGSSDFQKLASTMNVCRFCARCDPASSCQNLDSSDLGTTLATAFDYDNNKGSSDCLYANISTFGVDGATPLAITAVMKGNQALVSPWSLVATVLQTDLSVVSFWLASPLLPTICAGDIWSDNCLRASINGSTLALNDYSVENIMKLTASGVSFNATEGQNHMKWGVGTPHDGSSSSWVIFGSMNQQGSAGDNACDSGCAPGAQNGRGGDFFAFANATLWKSLTQMVSLVDTCASSNRTGGGTCSGGTVSPESPGTSDTFWPSGVRY